MLRLSVLLCAAMFVTLLIAGEDNGQLRPGLAAAVASGEAIIVVEPRKAKPVVAAAVEPVAPEPAPVEAVVESARYTPEAVLEEPVREVTPQPVFTLSDLPTVSVDAAPEAEVAEAAPSETPDDVWYVSANSVNVREGPSTDTSVLTKLTRGEAVVMVANEDAEWARILIEGDGTEGFVALRFLSSEAP